MSDRRQSLRPRVVEARQAIPEALTAGWFRPFWMLPAGNNITVARQSHALTALWYGYLHGVCVNDRLRFNVELGRMERCPVREPKTWCLQHGDRHEHTVWHEASKADRERAKALAASL